MGIVQADPMFFQEEWRMQEQVLKSDAQTLCLAMCFQQLQQPAQAMQEMKKNKTLHFLIVTCPASPSSNK